MGRPAVLKVDIIADAKGVSGGVSQAESKLGKLGSIGKKVGMAAAAGLAVAGAAAVKFGYDSVKAASEVQQSYGALDTIYGKNAAQVKKWATGAADSVGLAKSEYAGLSALVGSQLQGMGMEQDKSAKRSHKLIGLGADLAATYGGSVKDAVGAVSSLMKGEADPIERYGVGIKGADIAARMASMGLDKLTGKAEKQARAQATLSLLNEQTKKTTGAFARESNTLAGQQERLRAKFENVKATVGAKLLPVMTRLVTWVSNKLLPGAQKLGGELQRKLGPAFSAVGKFIMGTAVPAVRQAHAWFVDKIAPGIKRTLTPVLAAARSAFTKVSDAVKRNEPELRKLLGAVKSVVEFLAGKVAPIVGKVVAKAFGAMGTAIGGVLDALGWLIDKAEKAWGYLERLADKARSIPGVGKLIGGAVGNLTIGGVRLVGEAPSYDGRRGWSSASLATASLATAGTAGTLAGGGVTVIDRRDLSTTVQLDTAGALVVDESALARQLGKVLHRHAVRVGRATSYSGAGA